jgi:hypothetical protein
LVFSEGLIAMARICVGANDSIYLKAGRETEREREVPNTPFRGHIL